MTHHEQDLVLTWTSTSDDSSRVPHRRARLREGRGDPADETKAANAALFLSRRGRGRGVTVDGDGDGDGDDERRATWWQPRRRVGAAREVARNSTPARCAFPADRQGRRPGPSSLSPPLSTHTSRPTLMFTTRDESRDLHAHDHGVDHDHITPTISNCARLVMNGPALSAGEGRCPARPGATAAGGKGAGSVGRRAGRARSTG